MPINRSIADDFGVEVNRGTVRETFFASCFSNVFYSDVGDFRINDQIFEIGGRNKTFKQIKGVEDSYLVVDTDYTSEDRKIPWEERNGWELFFDVDPEKCTASSSQ